MSIAYLVEEYGIYSTVYPFLDNVVFDTTSPLFESVYTSPPYQYIKSSGIDGWYMQVIDMESTAPLGGKNCSFIDGEVVYSMNSLFSGVSATTVDVSEFDTSNVADMSYMFSGEPNIVGINYLDTSNVTNMSYMFYYNTSVTNLDLRNFDTSNVTDMMGMFSNCTNLTSLDLSSFDTSNVTNMSRMFYMDSSLISLDLSSLDTSNVNDMTSMFGSTGLTSLELTNFNTSNVTGMANMFSNTNFTVLDLSSFDTSSVTNMRNMFYNSSHLTTIYASDKFVTSGLRSSFAREDTFYGCTSLVGGAGSTYLLSYRTAVYARIDGGPQPTTRGYFTDVKDKPIN